MVRIHPSLLKYTPVFQSYDRMGLIPPHNLKKMGDTPEIRAMATPLTRSKGKRLAKRKR